jgi:transcriptional regulator with GAF, ATPase, and Fis domain
MRKEKTALRIDKNTFFREATLRICSSLNPDTALSQLLDYLKDFIPADGLTFGLFNPDKSELQVIAQIFTEKRDMPYSYHVVIPIEYFEKINQLWTGKEKVIITHDPDQEEESWKKKITPLLAWPEDSSAVIIKLDLQDHRIGAFAIHAKGKNRYKAEHLDLILMLHDPLAVAMSNALKYQEIMLSKETLADDIQFLQQQLLQVSRETIIGSDSGLKEVMKKVRQVAQLESQVLLLGETGSGKEVIANAIHHYSARKGGPFIKVNCGAIPETLIDSELFGHEKGAFTGAVKQKRGRFERAQNGTIFLDEIGELSLSAQVRLLRVIHNKEIERVGGISPISINARIISATNRNLFEMVRDGRFREDLWFRLNVFPITIPPLRDRSSDIPALVDYFIKRKSTELKIQKPRSLSPEALKKLMAYSWPGNIRELENVVERALIKSRIEDDLKPLSFESPEPSAGVAIDHEVIETKNAFLHLDELNRMHIRKALKLSRGRINGPFGAANLLGLNPSTLRGKMRKLNIVHGLGN